MNDMLTDSKTKYQFINKAGKDKYGQKSAVGNLIRYIARENGTAKDDLVCCGSFGAVDFTNIAYTIKQFECVQMTYRKENIARYIDHEIYSFSSDQEISIKKYGISTELLARKMAREIYEEGFQVYYGIHKKDGDDGHLHIHFAVNTVNYKTKLKRHENMQKTNEHGQKFSAIVDEEIKCHEEGV